MRKKGGRERRRGVCVCVREYVFCICRYIMYYTFLLSRPAHGMCGRERERERKRQQKENEKANVDINDNECVLVVDVLDH